MSQYFLENKMIYLKKLDSSNVTNEYISWMNNPTVNYYMETRFFPHSKKDIENFIDKIANDDRSILLGIFDKTSSKHIGNVKLGPINWIHRKATISLFIGNKDYLRKGYSTNVIKLIVDYAMNILNLHKIDAGVYAENIASKKAFENNGFVIEGIKKEDCYIDNRWIDVIIMGKINDN